MNIPDLFRFLVSERTWQSRLVINSRVVCFVLTDLRLQTLKVSAFILPLVIIMIKKKTRLQLIFSASPTDINLYDPEH